MKLLDPEYLFERVTKITPEFVKELGITNLLLDVDNTLTTQDNPEPAEGVVEWLDLMQSNGIKLMLVSNNHEPRVAPFANKLGLPYSYFSTKPLPRGFWKCFKHLGCNRKNTAVVGDQVLTDIIGAHLAGMKGFLVLSLGDHGAFGYKFNRRISKPVIEKYIKKHGGVL